MAIVTHEYKLPPGSEFLDYLQLVLDAIPEEAERLAAFVSQGMANCFNRRDTYGLHADPFVASMVEICANMYTDCPQERLARELKDGLESILDILKDEGYYDDQGYVTCWVSAYKQPGTITVTMFAGLSGKERLET